MNIISNRLRALSRGMALVCAVSVVVPASQAQAWAFPDTLKRYAQSVPGIHAAATFMQENKDTVKRGLGVALGTCAVFGALYYISKYLVAAKPVANTQVNTGKPNVQPVVVESVVQASELNDKINDKKDDQAPKSACKSGRLPGGKRGIRDGQRIFTCPTMSISLSNAFSSANNNIKQPEIINTTVQHAEGEQPAIEPNVDQVPKQQEQIEEVQQDQQTNTSAIVPQSQASDTSVALLPPTQVEVHELARKQAVNDNNANSLLYSRIVGMNAQEKNNKQDLTVSIMPSQIQQQHYNRQHAQVDALKVGEEAERGKDVNRMLDDLAEVTTTLNKRLIKLQTSKTLHDIEVQLELSKEAEKTFRQMMEKASTYGAHLSNHPILPTVYQFEQWYKTSDDACNILSMLYQINALCTACKQVCEGELASSQFSKAARAVINKWHEMVTFAYNRKNEPQEKTTWSAWLTNAADSVKDVAVHTFKTISKQLTDNKRARRDVTVLKDMADKMAASAYISFEPATEADRNPLKPVEEKQQDQPNMSNSVIFKVTDEEQRDPLKLHEAALSNSVILDNVAPRSRLSADPSTSLLAASFFSGLVPSDTDKQIKE